MSATHGLVAVNRNSRQGINVLSTTRHVISAVLLATSVACVGWMDPVLVAVACTAAPLPILLLLLGLLEAALSMQTVLELLLAVQRVDALGLDATTVAAPITTPNVALTNASPMDACLRTSMTVLEMVV